MNIDEAYQYCQNIANKQGPHFSVGFRFLPKPKRKAIFAVYAFCRYADDIVDERQSQPIDLLLKEWEDELYRCYRQEPSHPISIALADAICKYPIPIEGFLGLISGCKMDCTINRYPTYEALLVYCDKVATTIRDLSLPIFGYRNPVAYEYGQALSTALQLTNILRDVGEDLDRGRIYLPLDEIASCGYSEADLLARVKNGAFLKLVQFQSDRIRALFRESSKLLSLVDADARLALSLMRKVYIALIDQIDARPFDILDRSIRLSSFQKARIVLWEMLLSL
ncbi:MAG: squalene/phytoene synthase family protein [Nitrospirota bacterium]